MASFVGAQLERVAQLERAAELERERAEQANMHAAALESHMAERMFIVDARLPGSAVTYEHMYTLRHNALLDAHELLGRVRRLLHHQRLSRAVAVLDEEMGSEDEPEASEEESSDNDPVVDAESMAESMLARVSPPGWQPFSGRGSRLD